MQLLQHWQTWQCSWQYGHITSVEVLPLLLGVFSTKQAAEQAKEDFLEESGWEEGYGYHQGTDAESNIEIHEETLQ